MSAHDSPDTEREALLARRAAFEAQFADLDAPTHQTPEALEQLFDYFGVLTDLADLTAALRLLPHIREHILAARQEQPDDKALIEKQIDWNLTAVRFTAHNPRQFDDYEYYAEVIDLCRTAPDDVAASLEVRALQAELALVSAYRKWATDGGRLDALPDDQREYLDYLDANAANACDDQLTTWHDAQPPDYAQIIPLKRTLSRFYSQHRQPNEAIALLKELLEDLPQAPGTAPTDLADIHMEIGSILQRYKKFAAAEPYFTQAQGLYTQAGEEFEVQAAQAESWADECRTKK